MAVLDCNNISLKQGASGEKVKTLQTSLKELGYYSDKIDGSFGPITDKAVRAFQSAYKLTVDGLFGPVTCKKLNQVVDSKKQTTSQTKTESTVYLFDCSKTSLKRGAKGDDVKTLQTMLKAFGYYTRQVDGDFGVFTEQAVKAYQKQAGHDPDGWFGPKTCATLNVKYSEKVAQDTAKEKEKASSTANKQEGYVKPDYLKSLTAKLTVMPDVVVLPESSFDETTATKTVTEGSINAEVTFDCEKTSLKKGSQGADVKQLQTILKARGYYTREIDGDYGKYTAEAVTKLQGVLGQTADGWFGPETCKALKKTSATSSEATGTKDKKNTNFVITDFTTIPTFNDDIEGLSHEVVCKTPFSEEKLNRLRRLQKTQFDYYFENDVIYQHEGYINELKITQEDQAMLIEISMVGYTAFLDTQVEFEKTAKRSDLIKELAGLASLKCDVDVTGLTDDEFTVKATKAEASTGSSGGGGLVDVHGNDCTPTASISAASFDINTCHGNTKIGDSNANYARDTANMSAKEAILDVYNRFHYGPSLTSSAVYWNNRRCPQTMWQKTGKMFGNCADIARLIKAVGEVHGLKVGIRHCPAHYYNLIEVNGTTYRFDCCFRSGTTGSNYGSEPCNTLTKRGGPWS